MPIQYETAHCPFTANSDEVLTGKQVDTLNLAYGSKGAKFVITGRANVHSLASVGYDYQGEYQINWGIELEFSFRDSGDNIARIWQFNCFSCWYDINIQSLIVRLPYAHTSNYHNVIIPVVLKPNSMHHLVFSQEQYICGLGWCGIVKLWLNNTYYPLTPDGTNGIIGSQFKSGPFYLGEFGSMDFNEALLGTIREFKFWIGDIEPATVETKYLAKDYPTTFYIYTSNNLVCESSVFVPTFGMSTIDTLAELAFTGTFITRRERMNALEILIGEGNNGTSVEEEQLLKAEDIQPLFNEREVLYNV